MTSTAPRLEPGAAYRHEALLFDGTDALLRRAVPFLRDGVRAGDAVMVALVDDQWEPLRAALGDAADGVHRVDMREFGRNPARLIPAWQEFVDRHGAAGRPMRGLGELLYAGRRSAEIAECQIHEALLDLALQPRTPLWLLCPYDVTALGGAVLEDVRRSHPTVTDAGGTHARACPAGSDHLADLWHRSLPPATAEADTVPFGRGDLAVVRHLVRGTAGAAGLDRDRTEDLVLAVNELAANSLDHGGGHGVLRVWTEPGAFVCEVTDTGRLDDVMVGRTAPVEGQVRGRGVWMVNQLCDLVQIRSTASGTVVRVHSWM